MLLVYAGALGAARVREGIGVCVQILFELCRFRNAHPAFNGTFSLLDTISDIREAVLFVPSEPATPAAADGDAPLAQGLPASFESQDAMVEEGGGRFRAQAVAGAHGGEDSGGQNFMTDVVGASIDILDSIDQLDEHGDWCAVCARVRVRGAAVRCT